MTQYRLVVGAIAAVVLAFALYSLFTRGGAGPKHLDGWYFYNLDTGELFVQPLGTLPPVTPPGGKTDRGVRAFVFSCGECTEDEQFVHHLIALPADVKAALESGNVDDPQTVIGMNERIASPAAGDAELEWLPRHSPAGEALADEITTRCGNTPAKACRP